MADRSTPDPPRLGDVDGMAEFARANGARLFALGYVLTRDKGMAEDLVQDALLKLWAARGRGVREPVAYARRIMVNDFLNRRRRHEMSAALDHRPVTSPTPSLEAEVVEREMVHNAICQLSRRQQAAVVLRYFDDLSDAEIASALQCSAGTVRSLLSRARRQLHAALSEHLSEEDDTHD